MNTIFKLTWPYQVYAVQAIIDCIVQNCGNGKTLTFFKTSTLLKDNPAIEKCLFVVDHKDFDRQTREEFNRFQEGCVEANTNTAMRDGLKAEGNQLPATAWLKALPYTKERPCLEFPDRACCSGAGPRGALPLPPQHLLRKLSGHIPAGVEYPVDMHCRFQRFVYDAPRVFMKLAVASNADRFKFRGGMLPRWGEVSSERMAASSLPRMA